MTVRREKAAPLVRAYMAGGNATILQNLQDQIAGRRDVDSQWLRIEVNAESHRLDRTPWRPLVPGTLRNSVITGRKHDARARQRG